mgnify:CR=1 FL=1
MPVQLRVYTHIIMSIGIIIGSRISNVLEAALRFGCGIAVIGVAIEVVTYLAHAYRTLANADKEKIKKNLQTLNTNAEESDLVITHKKYETQIMVQWHVAIISAVVMMAIFIVACELAVGDFTQSLIQSLSVGIGFGLRDLVEDALYGILAMTQGYGTKFKFTNIKASKHESSDLLAKQDQNTSAEENKVSAETASTTTSTGCRIYQAHLTHVVLVPCDEEKPTTYIVKRWSQFYNTMEYQDLLSS